MLTDEDRKSALSWFLTVIEGISDIEYQKRVWIRGEGPEFDDFDETVCHFFDDGNPILARHKEYGITDSQHALLLKFRDAFQEFSDTHPSLAQLFIDTSEWQKIVEMAKEVLKAFHYKKK